MFVTIEWAEAKEEMKDGKARTRTHSTKGHTRIREKKRMMAC